MKKIKEFPKYSITKKGEVYSHYRNRNMTPKLKNTGYLVVNLRKNNKPYQKRIHRLVAGAYLPNPNNYKVVNHIDGNKRNNKLENLEWCTNSDNINHAIKTNLQKLSYKKVIQIDSTTNKIIKIHNSVKEAALCAGISMTSMTTACKNGKIYKKSKWKYHDDRYYCNVDISDWNPIPEYPNYVISTDGRIYSTKYKKLMRYSVCGKYYRVGLYNINNKRHKVLVHRMVAMCYIPNPKNYKIVNHKNGNGMDNNVENLEWTTHTQNIMHACSKTVVQYDLNENELNRYPSLKYAADGVSGSRSPISNACRKGLIYKGCKWKYIQS